MFPFMGSRNERALVALIGASLLVAGGCALGGERAPRSTGMGRLTVVDIGPLGLQQIEGTVKSVDANEGILVIERPTGDLRLETGKDTSIYVEGGVAALRDIEEGAPVRASFTVEGDDRLAHWIEVPRPEKRPADEEDAPNPVDAPPPDLSSPPGGRAP